MLRQQFQVINHACMPICGYILRYIALADCSINMSNVFDNCRSVEIPVVWSLLQYSWLSNVFESISSLKPRPDPTSWQKAAWKVRTSSNPRQSNNICFKPLHL